MIRVAIDVTEAKSLLADVGTGRERMQAVTDWTRQRVRRGLEALLRVELTVLLERERCTSDENERLVREITEEHLEQPRA